MTKKVHKVYQAIKHQFYATNVVVSKDPLKVVRAAFTGGVRSGSYIVNGKYATSDPAVQKGLEESPSFNVLWKLIHEFVIGEDPVEEAPAEIVKEAEAASEEAQAEPKASEQPEAAREVAQEDQKEEADEEPAQEESPAESPEKTVCEADTVQGAKEFLLEAFEEEATHRGLSNKDKVKQFAIEHNVELPNLK